MQVPEDYVRPTGLVATEGLELLTAPTPNGTFNRPLLKTKANYKIGQKMTVLLEELKAAYGLEYTFQSLFLPHSVQKEPWYTMLDPNGKIPVLVDHGNGGFAVPESLGKFISSINHFSLFSSVLIQF
jgi:hypothetical protein